MLKPAEITVGAVREAVQPLPDNANYVFKMMHGFYGVLFLSKFATGQVDADGKDRGIGSARKVWAHGLCDYSETVLIEAMGRCKVKHIDFPPSLPQFVALCVASLPPAPCVRAAPAIGIGQELRSSYARRARELIAQKAADAIKRKTGAADLPKGLAGLGQAIADAVAAAGGDEATSLREFGRMFPKVAA